MQLRVGCIANISTPLTFIGQSTTLSDFPLSRLEDPGLCWDPTPNMNIDDTKHSTGSWLPIGTVLQDRYRIERRLGRGGMGAVYEATDLRLGHSVALKQSLTADSDLWKQFECEARLMAQLNHPVFPRVNDYFVQGNRAFLVMQFIEGSSLADIMALQPGPLPTASVVAWADQLLDALIYLHSHDRQIVHRDIKPHNLKVTPAGKIALLDFGLAKSRAANVREEELEDSVYGYSPRYAPLEQIKDLGTTPQSDIYALGATLYHLLTGVKPPDALTRANALNSAQPNLLKPAHEINSAIPAELSAILNRAMEQNPDHRYPNANAFREALGRLGRVEVNQDLEFVAHPAAIEAAVSPVDELKLFRPVEEDAHSTWRGTAAMMMTLILAFGIFCHYYPWKLPGAEAGQSERAPFPTVATQRRSRVENSSDPAALGINGINKNRKIQMANKYGR